MDRYDWMLRRGGGRPHGPPPRNPFGPRGMGYGSWGSPDDEYGYRDRGVYGEAYPGPAPGYPGMRGRGGHTLGGGNRGGQGRVPGEFGDAPYGSYGYGEMRGGFGGQGGQGGYRGFGGRPGGGGFRGGYGGQEYGGGRPSQGRGYDRVWGGEGGFAREPFMPEEAYRRHPEYNQPRGAQRGHEFEWEDEEDMGDGDVLRAVRERMYQDVWLDTDRINVEVEDGVVTLTGEVDDFLEARYAWDDAWESPGVRGVINNLTVRTDEPHAVSETHGDVVPQSAGGHTVLEGDAGGGAGV